MFVIYLFLIIILPALKIRERQKENNYFKAMRYDEKRPDRGEIFVVTEREYECPVCHVPLDKHHKECLKCDAKFWSPVKRSKEKR